MEEEIKQTSRLGSLQLVVVIVSTVVVTGN